MNGVYGEYFYGNKVSDYGIENGYVDYRTFAKAFDAVMANDFMQVTSEIGYWEQVSGDIEDTEVFQWFIITQQGAEICEDAGEIVFYNEELDLYLWGVTHWGTAWDYVLTDIRCNMKEEE